MGTVEDFNDCDQSLLDRFVDGELSDEEERIVLSGWSRLRAVGGNAL